MLFPQCSAGPFTSYKTEHGSSSTVFCEDNIDPVTVTTPVNTNLRPTLGSEIPTFCAKLSPTSENKTFAAANLSMRILAAAHATDLNERSLDAEYSNSPIPKKHVQPGRLAVPHWARNIDHPSRDASLTHSFYDWLSTTTSTDLKKLATPIFLLI